MGCLFSNARLGHEVAMPRPVAAQAIGMVAIAAAAEARDRWERELAAWLAAQARAMIGGADGFDVGDMAWSPDHFAEQQQFVTTAVSIAASRESGELRFALDRLAALIAGHERSWVLVGRRWTWPDRAPEVP